MSFFARWKLPGFTAALLLAMVLARVLYGSVSELHAGEDALSAGNTGQAIVHLERAIHWYIPGSPTVSSAARHLWTIGQSAEQRGDTAQALEAYQALRSAFYATRSFYTPHPEWIARADDRIAALQAKATGSSWPDPALSEDRRKQVALEALQKDTAPSAGWSALAALGFLGWIVSAVGFLLRAFDPAGRFEGRQGLRWGAGIVVGYALWVVGLTRA